MCVCVCVCVCVRARVRARAHACVQVRHLLDNPDKSLQTTGFKIGLRDFLY